MYHCLLKIITNTTCFAYIQYSSYTCLKLLIELLLVQEYKSKCEKQFHKLFKHVPWLAKQNKIIY